ncbi:MAG TPA: alpha-L-fucosidase [Bryobacteraceae bacterium]|nr:alpha-L-fucosidase [Bryobacteraceae bacterium]
MQRSYLVSGLSRRRFLQSAGLAAAAVPAFAAAAPPAPYGALPSRRQLLWHEMEVYGFLHFTINTFTDKEWGYGDESPELFNPTAFDADAIVSALKAGGMKGVILTCKHHDGFCLWPTRTTEHSVRNSPFRNGKGDVVWEISEAARRQGLKFGVYLSPWDRNNAAYGTPAYVATYRAQLRELLTNYGALFEVWHDGANGGDGYYGGAREKRVIDKRTYYQWPETWDMIRSLQPDAVIFSDVGPDIRWVGNERGIANETCWATYDPVSRDGGPASPGDVRERESSTGHRNGSKWLPAECDVSIRPGWFWHEAQNARVKTPDQLMDLYYKSVGRGAGFLLNVPPDRRGLLHENDVASLRGFGQALAATFRQDLAAKAKAKASNVRGSFAARNLVDGRPDTYWSTADSVTTAEVVFDLARPATFDTVRLRENIRLGQRIERFSVDAWRDEAWQPIGSATSIGACRLLRTAAPISTPRVRLRIEQSAAPIALSEFGLYAAAGA